MSDDPFAELGLTDTASADDVRAARRRLAKEHHPDRGGDADVMRSVNDAAAAALAGLAGDGRVAGHPGAPPDRGEDEPAGMTSDVPSFTVEALPVETFEALMVVADTFGSVLDDDPPYRLDVHLRAPITGWCRLDVVPDAGASTVSITVGTLDDHPPPGIDAVRDLWIDRLNRLDWDRLRPE